MLFWHVDTHNPESSIIFFPPTSAVSPLSGECQAELFDIRKSLMEDYKVNPEIVTLCGNDIEQYCKGLRREGKTLHCLMERAMKKKLAEQCTNAVSRLTLWCPGSHTDKVTWISWKLERVGEVMGVGVYGG